MGLSRSSRGLLILGFFTVLMLCTTVLGASAQVNEDDSGAKANQFDVPGGVHSNSGIPNHAYYLLVNGGINAGEARDHEGPKVTGIGLADAERIFYLGFTSLDETASMSEARDATVELASALYGAGSQQETSTSDAWDAVGVEPVAAD